MLIVAWRDGTVDWFDARHVQVDGGEAAVRRVLTQPAVDQEPVATEEPGVGMAEVVLKPGTQRHARAALRKLPGARVMLDDGDA